jgi:hypothetical protein
MRLSPGDPSRIEQLQARYDKLLDQSWRGKDAEDLARQLRRLRLQITIETTTYQAGMRELQRERSKRSS